MVSPVLKPAAVSVEAYFPAGNWFDLISYSSYVSVNPGTYITLDAPPDHINVHIREGNIIAMQGEEMTTEAARKTPFQILAVMSKSENSSGEVFLDDGEGVEMGEEGGRWTLVRLYGRIVGKKVIVGTEVVNGEFALSQKWIVETVTFVGLEKFIEVNGCEVITKSSAGVQGTSIRKSSDESGQFVTVVVSGLSLLIGDEFKMELDMGTLKNRKQYC